MKPRIKLLADRLRIARRAHPLLFWIRVVVFLAVAGFFVFERNFWTPDTLFIALLVVAIVFGVALPFIYRFLPFASVLLVYDSFRGIATSLNSYVHYTEMPTFDRWLFHGVLPTTVLQQWLWHGHLQWYDFYFYLLYTLHFAMPIFLAVVLWRLRDKLYWPFVIALTMLSFVAFFTYVIFPASPPWLAAQSGYIPPIEHLSSDLWGAMGVTNFSQLYAKISPNLVAAVPSLHAAYPTLFLLFAAKAFGWRRMWWLALYPLSIWFGIVYLGEHYVFDTLLGVAYAVASYHITLLLFAWKARRDIHVRRWIRSQGQRAWAYVHTSPLEEE
jgi:hypothetical protein